MQKRITSELENAIKCGESIGRKNGIHYVGTEEIVYGMVAFEGCSTKAILESFGVTPEKYLIHLQKTFNKSSTVRGFTPNSNSAFDLSNKISDDSGVGYISSAHLLLAIAYTRTCHATQILINIGVDVPSLIQRLTRIIFPQSTPVATPRQNESVYGKKYTTPQELSELDGIGYDLTLKAYSGALDPVIGRNTEINDVIRSLTRKTKNSPVLIGEPGVGKSAIVEGLAQEIAEGRVPDVLLGKTIFALDLAAILASAKYRGEFEQKFKRAIEVFMKNEVIVFIDEIHNIMGAGKTEGSYDASEILKPILARGGFHLIGATTYDEYVKIIEPDEAFSRRLQPVFVKAPSVADSIEILKGIKSKYEAYHRVEIREDAIKEAVCLTDRYIGDRQLPDKAIDIIDECAAEARLQASAPEKKIVEINEKIAKIDADMEYAGNVGDKSAYVQLEAKKNEYLTEILKIRDRRLATKSGNRPFIDGSDVAKMVSVKTGIPMESLTREEADRLLNLESELHERVIGQNRAVKCVSSALRRSRAGLSDPKRPLGSFIFVGPTGVGKTELAKALAEVMFGDEKYIIRIDMAEYMQREDITKLIGAPPGYVGYSEEGYLTSRVRKEPYSVVLFDEIEKAHADIFNIFLQILDEGRLTDNKGRTVDFKNTIIIMTSNAGITNEVRSEQEEYFAIESALKKAFRPEFLNRVDEIIHFNRLNFEESGKIVKKMLSSLEKQLRDRGIKALFDASVIKVILDKGYSVEYGARPLKDVIRNRVTDMLSDRIISGDIKRGDKIRLFAYGGEIDFEIL